jgi:hypothetical protein
MRAYHNTYHNCGEWVLGRIAGQALKAASFWVFR